MLPFPRPPGADTEIDRMRKATPSLLLGAAAAAALLLAGAPTPAPV
jgi:hypothetical protein